MKFFVSRKFFCGWDCGFRRRSIFATGWAWPALVRKELVFVRGGQRRFFRIGSIPIAPVLGMAVGKNPISFVVPCHRVIGKSGALTGYHWGLTRKRAILGWEAGQTAAG